MFQFRRFPSYAYLIQRRMTGYCPAGFPHSDIHGSRDICSSPWLFAACRVLLRLLMPRHSPCALSSLTNRKRFLVLIVELCRHFTDSRNCNCYPSPIRCSTIKITLPCLFRHRTSLLPYFTCFRYIVQFSRCGLQLLLKPDLKVQVPGL